MSQTLKFSFILIISLSYHSSVIAQEDEAPSLELLEFLGSFETNDGEWVDPMAIDELSNDIHKQSIEEENKDE